MDPVGFKKGHPTWEFYVNAKRSLDISSKWLLSFSLKFDFKITLHFIYVLQLNQLKVCCLNFSAKVSRQEAAERERHKLTFEKSTVQQCYVERGWKTRTPLLWPTKLLLPSKRIKLFPFSVCRGKLSCSKTTGNDCDAGRRAQPQLLRTWHFLWVLHTDTPIRFC